jgi:ABC-type branched-chain amino acid transport system, permease component
MVLQSIRENEARTRAIGYPVEHYKIVAVMLSGLFAGLAGVLYAVQNRFAAPDFVFFVVSGEVVIYNVVGGIGTLVGPIVGAGFFLLLRRGIVALPDAILPDPGGPHFHRDGYLPAAGAARVHATMA